MVWCDHILRNMFSLLHIPKVFIVFFPSDSKVSICSKAETLIPKMFKRKNLLKVCAEKPKLKCIIKWGEKTIVGRRNRKKSEIIRLWWKTSPYWRHQNCTTKRAENLIKIHAMIRMYRIYLRRHMVMILPVYSLQNHKIDFLVDSTKSLHY